MPPVHKIKWYKDEINNMNKEVKIQKTELANGDTRYLISNDNNEVLFVCKEEDYDNYYEIAISTLDKMNKK